jgi:hypothetical protein
MKSLEYVAPAVMPAEDPNGNTLTPLSMMMRMHFLTLTLGITQLIDYPFPPVSPALAPNSGADALMLISRVTLTGASWWTI